MSCGQPTANLSLRRVPPCAAHGNVLENLNSTLVPRKIENRKDMKNKNWKEKGNKNWEKYLATARMKKKKLIKKI